MEATLHWVDVGVENWLHPNLCRQEIKHLQLFHLCCPTFDGTGTISAKWSASFYDLYHIRHLYTCMLPLLFCILYLEFKTGDREKIWRPEAGFCGSLRCHVITTSALGCAHLESGSLTHLIMTTVMRRRTMINLGQHYATMREHHASRLLCPVPGTRGDKVLDQNFRRFLVPHVQCASPHKIIAQYLVIWVVTINQITWKVSFTIW